MWCNWAMRLADALCAACSQKLWTSLPVTRELVEYARDRAPEIREALAAEADVDRVVIGTLLRAGASAGAACLVKRSIVFCCSSSVRCSAATCCASSGSTGDVSSGLGGVSATMP